MFSSELDMNPKFPENEHLKCPRCDSSNTKFCYYNNYNLSQPRHFCKNCRRYWTKGGTLRNIPVGGGTRKITKRSSNTNKRTPTVTAPSPGQPKREPEPSGSYGFGDQRMEVGGGSFSSLFGSSRMGPYGNLLMDGLSPSPSPLDKSNEDVLIRNPIADEFRNNLLRLNTNNGRGSGGGNGCPDLSIFNPGSSFH